MPIYEFRCDRCSEQFEELLRAADARPDACPACGFTELTRVLSPFATEWKPSEVEWHRVPGSRGRD